MQGEGRGECRVECRGECKLSVAGAFQVSAQVKCWVQVIAQLVQGDCS